MAPRGAALLPLLTVLGTTAAAAVLAHQFVPKYFENKYKKQREQRAQSQESQATPTTTMATVVTTTQTSKPKTKPAPLPAEHEAEKQSSMVAAVLLQDPFLLISAFGVCVMVVAVLVSLALVAVRDDVASLNDLQMFPPLMLIAMGMISLGMVLSMVNPKKVAPVVEEEEEEEVEEKTISEADAAALKKAAKEGDQGFLYNYYKKKYGDRVDEDAETLDQDGQPKKRVSKCPFGF